MVRCSLVRRSPFLDQHGVTVRFSVVGVTRLRRRVAVKVVDVDAGIDDARNTVRLGADAVASKLPQPSARPVAWRHRARAVLCEPEAVSGEITIDAVTQLFFDEKPRIE